MEPTAQWGDGTSDPGIAVALPAELGVLADILKLTGAERVEAVVALGGRGCRLAVGPGALTDVAPVRRERLAAILDEVRQLHEPAPTVPPGFETLRLELHSRDLRHAAVVALWAADQPVGYLAAGGVAGPGRFTTPAMELIIRLEATLGSPAQPAAMAAG